MIARVEVALGAAAAVLGIAWLGPLWVAAGVFAVVDGVRLARYQAGLRARRLPR